MTRYTRQSFVLGVISFFISAVVLVGWFANIDAVKSVLPGMATMKFNTALCFLLSAGALALFALRFGRGVAHALAVLSLLIAVATLWEYWGGVQIGIDEWVVVDPDTPMESFPGRMSTATAFCFFMLNISLLFLGGRKEGAAFVRLGQAFAMGTFIGGMIGVLGYLMEVSALYNFFWFSSMAVHTSLLFVVLSSGTLLMRPQQGMMETLTSQKMGGQFARRLVPVVLLLPMLLGWLLVHGAMAGYYEPVMIADLFTVITMLVFGAFIWLQAAKLNRTHEELIEQNKLLREAQRSDALLAAIIESSDAAVVSENMNGTIMTWNRAAEKMYGYTEKEMIGKTMARLIPHDDLADESEIIQSIRQGARTGHFEAKRQCKNGNVLDVSVMVSSIVDDAGKLIGVSRITRNVTEHKRVEGYLQDSLREIQDLKTALDEHAIVAITNPRGEITYVNDKFCAISKYAREELIGQDHRILNSGYHTKDFMRGLWKTISQGHVWHGKIRNRAKDGSIYWVETTIVPFMGANGKPRQFVAVRSDITESMRVSETLVRQAARLARSNKDLEQFAYIASHDLQEPLRAVAGCVQLLKKRYEGKLDEKADQFIAHTVDGAERMQRLIQDLLAFSRVSTRGEAMQEINLVKPLKIAMKNLSVLIEECGATIIHDSLPDVRCDAGQLAMLFQNLIGNGLKFRGERPPEINIGVEKKDNKWVISVRDNGIGIDADYFERIFVIFQRLHTRDEYAGTGIGLALCKRIAERHGGSIWVESTPGEGSTFYFTICEDIEDD